MSLEIVFGIVTAVAVISVMLYADHLVCKAHGRIPLWKYLTGRAKTLEGDDRGGEDKSGE